jgi:hypothetical protein
MTLQPKASVVIAQDVCEFANSTVEIQVCRPALLFPDTNVCMFNEPMEPMAKSIENVQENPHDMKHGELYLATMDYAQVRHQLSHENQVQTTYKYKYINVNNFNISMSFDCINVRVVTNCIVTFSDDTCIVFLRAMWFGYALYIQFFFSYYGFVECNL